MAFLDKMSVTHMVRRTRSASYPRAQAVSFNRNGFVDGLRFLENQLKADSVFILGRSLVYSRCDFGALGQQIFHDGEVLLSDSGSKRILKSTVHVLSQLGPRFGQCHFHSGQVSGH